MLLDITATHEGRGTMVDIVRRVADSIFIPFTVGGGISSVDDFTQLLRAGADKISVNSAAVRNPQLINDAAYKFGSQCVVCAIDAKRREDGGWEVYLNGGRIPTGIDAVKAAIDDGDWFGALDGLGEMADSFLSDMENLVANLPTLPSALNQWMDRLNHFKEMAGTIIATPGRLVSELSSFIDGVVDLVTEPPEALAVYTTLRNQWAGERARQVATGALPEDITVKPGSVADGEIGFAIGLSPDYQPVSDSLQKNIDDFRQVVVLETMLGQANAVASMTFDTSDAALSAGDTLAAELHEQAVAAVENNQRALWRTLRDLRQAVITDARERAARLPETRQVTLTTTTSAALLAWREHGDTSRRDEIVQRNRLRHPSFILPTQPVEITD